MMALLGEIKSGANECNPDPPQNSTIMILYVLGYPVPLQHLEGVPSSQREVRALLVLYRKLPRDSG